MSNPLRGFAAGPERELESSRREKLHPFSKVEKNVNQTVENCDLRFCLINGFCDLVLFDCRFLMRFLMQLAQEPVLYVPTLIFCRIMQTHFPESSRIFLDSLLILVCLAHPGAGLRSSICFHRQCEIRWCLASRKPRC